MGLFETLGSILAAPVVGTAALGTAAVGALSGGISTAVDVHQQNKTNALNQDIAREQMAFQERMSNTAYARATEDMRRSGINPMLAYMKGGASSPSGASSTAIAPQIGDKINRSLSSAMEMATMSSNLKKIESDTKLNNELINTQKTQQALNAEGAKATSAKAAIDVLNGELMKTTIPAQQARGKFEAEHSKYLAPLDAVTERLQNITGAIPNLRGLFKGAPVKTEPLPRYRDDVDRYNRHNQVPDEDLNDAGYYKRYKNSKPAVKARP